MYQLSRLVSLLVLAATLAVSGCKKQDASPAGKTAEQAASEASAPPAATEGDPAAPKEASSPDAETEAAAPEAASEPAAPAWEDSFAVKLETTKGDIVIDVNRDWSPLGAERFHELVSSGFYNDVAFFRVMENFMAQTGVSGNPSLNRKWGKKKIKDEPPKTSNTRGTVSFAKAGPNSRTTQFFINLVDNSQLDAMLFAPFGKVRDMTAADALFAGYGDGPPQGKGPNQQKLKAQGNKYLKKKFPKLDYITSATILDE